MIEVNFTQNWFMVTVRFTVFVQACDLKFLIYIAFAVPMRMASASVYENRTINLS
jgi:hypothetical protein